MRMRIKYTRIYLIPFILCSLAPNLHIASFAQNSRVNPGLQAIDPRTAKTEKLTLTKETPKLDLSTPDNSQAQTSNTAQPSQNNNGYAPPQYMPPQPYPYQAAPYPTTMQALPQQMQPIPQQQQSMPQQLQPVQSNQPTPFQNNNNAWGQGNWAPNGYNPNTQMTNSYLGPVNGPMPTDAMIPEFGKPLPNASNTQNGQGYNPFAANSYPAPTPNMGYQPYSPMPNQAPYPAPNYPYPQPSYPSNYQPAYQPSYPSPSSYPSPNSPPTIEDRLSRLEQAKFQNVYPSHMIEDRLEHLEKDILGSANTSTNTPIEDRLSILETKVFGRPAFSSANN